MKETIRTNPPGAQTGSGKGHRSGPRIQGSRLVVTKSFRWPRIPRSLFLALLVLSGLAVGCRKNKKERLEAFLNAAPSASISALSLPPAEARRHPDAVWIDVRTRAERSQGYLPQTRLIPLAELPARLGEIEHDRDTILVCASGARATEAARLLQASGFSRVHVLEGGMLSWDGPVLAPRLDPDGPGFTERFRVGVSFVVVQKPDPEHPHAGLEVHTVYPGGPAHKKLVFGEVVTTINERVLDEETLRTASYKALFPPGKSNRLRVRGLDGSIREETLPPPPDDPLPPISSTPLPAAALWQSKLNSALQTDEGQAFRHAFRAQTRAWLPSANTIAASALMDPLSFGSLLASPPSTPLPGTAPHDALERTLTSLPGLPLSLPSRADLTLPREATPMLQAIAALLRESHKEAALSEDAIAQNERGAFRDSVAKIRKNLEQRVFVHDRPTREETTALLALTEQGRLFRPEPCLRGVLSLGRALRPSALAALRAVAGGPEREPPPGIGITGTILGLLETPEGRVVLGGRGNNQYQGKFAAILDPAGDDRYAFSAGEEPSLLLDLEGNDRYELTDTDAAWAPGRALLQADLAGNDVYSSTGSGLASGYFSASVLLDAAGDDRYTSERAGLGAGRFGVGVLLDLDGKDHYTGGRGTQGFGGPGGLGVLLDARGDDAYETTPSRGVDHPEASFAQGCGMGIRELSYGGLGLLLDGAGSDRYSAKDYAQGVGYFGGLGVLRDHAGDDVYTGSKYTQGAGVHGAVGLLWDGQGNDRYALQGSERGQGMAWDLALAALIDGRGEDHIDAPGMAQGYGAQNGMALLIHQGGTLRRRCENESCGGLTGNNDYAGGRGTRSFAWLLER